MSDLAVYNVLESQHKSATDEDCFEPQLQRPIQVTTSEIDTSCPGDHLLPMQNKSRYINAEGVITDIVSISYADYNFVSITQLQKFGTIIRAWADRHADGFAGITYEMNVLLGKREDTLLMVYARQIIQRIALSSDKPLILAIALQEGEAGRNTETFNAVLNSLYSISHW